MMQPNITPTIILTSLAAILVSCGPESNTRYGDQYWDPNDTKDKFDPVEVPEYTVTYREITPNVDYDAYIAIDFSDLDREANGVSFYYTRGISGEKPIDDLLQSNSSVTDSSFLFDLEAATDYRLVAQPPGEYTLVLDFDLVWPNGNTVSYLMDDIEFTVPGCQTNSNFFTDYANPVLAENCVDCHGAGGEASTAFSLSSTDLGARQTQFLTKAGADDLPEGAGSMTMLQYVFNQSHEGYETAIGITGDELTAFQAYLEALERISNDFDRPAITSDFTFEETDTEYEFCFARPATFVIEEF